MGFQQRASGLVVNTAGCVMYNCGSIPTDHLDHHGCCVNQVLLYATIAATLQCIFKALHSVTSPLTTSLALFIH
jgi:hypothetical protein